MSGAVRLAAPLLLLTLAVASLQWAQPLTLLQQWQLLLAPQQAQSLDDILWLYSQLPRLAITLLVGATLGLAGSVMQQLTQNALMSPLTMGTSSGAWLALVLLAAFWPGQQAQWGALAAMGGALLAFALIVLIAGLDNMTGLPMVIAGMVINILLGALASGVLLLQHPYAQNIFLWGSGDLAQSDWGWVRWLLPRLTPALLLLLFAPRVLQLLRLGHQGAQARGAAVVPLFFALMLLTIWLVSAAVTAVGLIGFIGLLTPNIVRALGVRTPRGELYASLLGGALLLLLTDALAQGGSLWLGQLLPTGVVAAAIGAPALILFSRRRLSAPDGLGAPLISARGRVSAWVGAALTTLAALALLGYLTYQPEAAGWPFAWPQAYQWALRWPRALVALSCGGALALAGVLLQRLMYNPLASPDLLGVSSGATLTLVLAMLWCGQTLTALQQWGVGLAGSLAVLAALMALGRRQRYAPASVILTGIALTALLQALVQFFLAQGGQDSYRILQWLAGSTYRVTAVQALLLSTLTALLLLLALFVARALTLLSIGRAFSQARGLNGARATALLLALVALLCAIATAAMGPVAFVGLMAPHLAQMLGARTARAQMGLAALLGAATLLWADWLGQALLYPRAMAAGTLVAIVGATYFLLLLIAGRLTRRRLQRVT
ncbi:Fe(3+)-hydroxamate ABC transporter permease FhuB [Edwardsiella anguillarum]|uniref:Fe(3+)-hydroxamate ABC transporter permease FhuB n=1 Tax=Edwardsiella anguillarum TaxID=1821960 RepID=UPI00045CD528|nr:Fe(3+)-hydroxamate ABC transporter permease FhuB [Edwardsiella anguillarum]GAJ66881.1 ABC transporter, iron chelate uptake transporter family, permease protein [Edwardsiella piscicida]RFT05122.1 Fe3+-hydroxamate ABC transporter permease FhuB [Edwardsiella anguillarum]BET79827.1 Fe(3+)-hydroxamate ABC transporter permease FhuB [Edwardsiella anguillarum]BET83114.1 Fe(3+)-hydroxamate ABC transporter permease FhuB [Edwardsiella anguillarum]BET86482.1 Fe(3+)-hydroxamate ABC transporter permease 